MMRIHNTNLDAGATASNFMRMNSEVGMSERKQSRRKFDGEPHILTKGQIKAWFYNNAKTVDLFVSDNAGKTLTVTIRKTKLREMAELP